jgi:hypothetical protein
MVSFPSLYPDFGIAKLRSQHGHRWADLIDHVRQLPVSDPHVMALALTVRRLHRDTPVTRSRCHDPSCAVCAAEAVASFKGTEQELLDLYLAHLKEIMAAIKSLRLHRRVAAAVPSAA